MGPGFDVGDDCFIGPNVVFCNDRWPRAVKKGWDDVPLRAGAATIVCEDRVSIGANATILPGVRIGARSMVAAGAVVHRNVPQQSLFKRDGTIAQIDTSRPQHRMHLIA